MAKKLKYDNKELTKHLRELAAQMHDVLVDEDLQTRARTKGQALCELVYEKALGRVEKKIDEEGVEQIIVHKPEQWALQLIFDRMEGRAPQAVPDNEGKRTAKDQVSAIAKGTINQLAPMAGPPAMPKKEKPDA
jgi:hypothetical protein